MQTNFETNFFLKTSTPGVCSWLLWVSSTEMYLLSSHPLYHSASPLQSLPTCVHTPLSEFRSCAQAHRSPLGTQACPLVQAAGAPCLSPPAAPRASWLMQSSLLLLRVLCHLRRSLVGAVRGWGVWKEKKPRRAKCLESQCYSYQGKSLPNSSVRCHFLTAVSEVLLHFMLVILSRWIIHFHHAEADLNVMVQLPNASFSFRRTSLNRNKCICVLWDPESNPSRPLWSFSF